MKINTEIRHQMEKDRALLFTILGVSFVIIGAIEIIMFIELAMFFY